MRELGTSQDCKAPITPELLLKFKSILDLDCHYNIVFWAACLTGFYGFLRPNNFLVKGSFDPDFNLRRVVTPVSKCLIFQQLAIGSGASWNLWSTDIMFT
jgi:hypothetical protein